MLYAFGSNGAGQLGIGGKDDANTPRKCLLDVQSDIDEPQIRIVAGGNHTLLLFKPGSLYSVGSNRDARAGHATAQEWIEAPQMINLGTSSTKIKLCAAGWESSVIVTEANEVYTCGTGPKGELGIGNVDSSRPQKLLDFPPAGTDIVDVASCVSHTVVVLSTGDVYGWGNGRKGQLGEPAQVVWEPRRIENVTFKVVRAVCGKEFTYLVGDPQHGYHTILGADKWGVRSNAPVDNIDWQDVGASWGSIFVLKRNGRIESWGRNDHGQLAPTDLPHIYRMAVGSEHLLALTHQGQVLTWGWGEHGNCGPNTDQMGDVKDGWNEISLNLSNKDAKPSMIAAGCATSFIWT
ncbi:hypothetical protein MMC07_002783 [Pseudocyphellaria aurata]|nr:hypothetical protein [Pseudocyphellaria aurata]